MTKKPPTQLQQLLQNGMFELAPFNVAVIDNKFNIREANGNFEEYFGDWRGRKCYEVYKHLSEPCPQCQATQTFGDGRVRVSDETGVDRHGRTCHYVVHLAPLKDKRGQVKYVIEMSTDITETRRWQREYNLLFERVPCYITVIDRNFRIIRANEKFRQAFGEGAGQFCYRAYKDRAEPCGNCPAAAAFADGKEHVSTQTGIMQDGSLANYIVTASPLSRGPGGVAHIIEISTDISELKKLEGEKLDAERLAAVGQTVAGLAHTIKNMLMGLDGGMYMVDTGLRRSDSARIAEGWEILQRNFDKTTSLVKDFLSFAKGRLPVLDSADPVRLAANIVDFYRNAARQQGVELLFETEDAGIPPAPLDMDGMEVCLTNLLSNAIDAATLREESGGRVTVRVKDREGDLIFEVEDNGCGMDAEVKQKIFTTFFSTKGDKGTGLGLLTTRKIVQEHGGAMETESQENTGSIFRIRLPRARLVELMARNRTEAGGPKEDAP